MQGVMDAGLVDVKPGLDDPVAMKLLNALSKKSRERWPGNAVAAEAFAPILGA